MPTATDAPCEGISIGDLSRLTGVHIETIRYYEKVEMLPAPPRSDGGRRIYGPNHERTLTFIRRARKMGFTLEEIRALLDLSRPDRTSCAEVREIAAAHLENVRAKLENLMRLETILSQTIARCDQETPTTCPVLDMLEASNQTASRNS